MLAKRFVRLAPALIAMCAATACVPMPVALYSADPAQGKLLYSTCAINKDVPDGIELQLDGVLAQVKLQQAFSRDFVEVRLDVPSSRTVQWQSDVVAVDLHDGRAPVEARYPNVSLVDSPGIHSFDPPPALAKYMMPVGDPMVGGEIRIGNQISPKHFWMAARIATEKAERVTIWLPAMSIDGAPVRFAPLEFRRQHYLVLAALNC